LDYALTLTCFKTFVNTDYDVIASRFLAKQSPVQ
jgi:hypothetical protein